MNDHPVIDILLVDDHAMVREGLRAFLQLAEDVVVVGEAASGKEAIEFIQNKDLDVILMDLVMPGEINGIEATRWVAQNRPSIHVIALTSFQDEERILDALSAGASGYLRKDVSPDDLLSAIRQAAAGRAVLEASAMNALRQRNLSATIAPSPSSMKSAADVHVRPTEPGQPNPINLSVKDTGETEADRYSLPDADSLIEQLTQRELEILHWLARGLSNKEIGVELGITEKTVKVHVSHILSKFGVYDRTQAVIVASRIGLVQL